jgi:hypothetical protein
MARYEDDGIEFAQQQFAKARDYREEQAKKQEKFAKRLQMANLAVSGVNFALNQKADALETSRATQRAHYLTQLENAKGWQTMVQGYEKEGLTREQMLYREKQKQLTSYVQNEFGVDFDISGYSDAINRISKEYSDDKVNLASFNKAVDAQLAIPNLSQDDMIKLIQQEGAAPRSIGAFLGNSMMKLAKSHDKETMTAADKAAKDRMLGGLIGEQFSASKTALEEYAAKGNPIEKMVNFLKSEEGKAIPVFKDVSREVTKEREVDRFGNIVEVEYVANYGTDRRTGGQILIGDRIKANSNRTAAKEKTYSEVDIARATSQIASYVRRSGNVDLQNSLEEYADESEILGLSHNVITSADKLRKQYNISESKAIGLATKHILQQDGELIETDVNLYEYEKLEGTADTENVMSYIKSIQETSPKKSQEVIGKMYEEMVTGIQRNPNLTDEEKIGELNILNDLVSPYTAIVGPEARRKTPEDMDREAQGEVIEPLSSAEASQKYKINEELVARLIEMKPTRGAVTQQSPLRDDPIDLITDEMLYEAGYISPGKDAPFFKIRGRRKFIQDFYNDLGQ